MERKVKKLKPDFKKKNTFSTSQKKKKKAVELAVPVILGMRKIYLQRK